MRLEIRTLAIFALALAASCSAPLLLPTEQDAARAQASWPGITVSSLQEGHDLYVVKCSSCHYLYRPQEFEPERWTAEVEEMSVKAKLSQAEKESILQYLVTMSLSSQEQRPR